MANTFAPNGFQVSRLYNSSVPNYAMSEARIAYNYSSSIAFGDPVALLNTGLIALYAFGGTTIHGIFAGCEYLDYSTGEYLFRQSWPAVSNLPSTYVVKARVIVDPMVVFRVQGYGTAATQTAIGNNIDIKTGTSGVPNAAGISTCSVDLSTINTTNTLPFRIVGIPAGFWGRSYDPTADNNWLEVRMNTSDALAATGI